MLSDEAALLLRTKCSLERLDEGTHRLVAPGSDPVMPLDDEGEPTACYAPVQSTPSADAAALAYLPPMQRIRALQVGGRCDAEGGGATIRIPQGLGCTVQEGGAALGCMGTVRLCCAPWD